MPEAVSSLYELCLDATAVLLKSAYWNTNFPFGCNPFAYAPSLIVDTLIVRVVRLSLAIPLESSDLRLLLISGRVRNFLFEDVNLSGESLREILMDLSTACADLQKIKIRNVYCNIVHRMNLHMKTIALNLLLSQARKLKHVESCIEFDLEALANCRDLECLILNFPVRNYIFDFLEVDGELTPHPSLKHIEIFEDQRHPVPHVDIAVVLTYCTELRDIDCDISKSLEYLHAEELYNGTLSKKYKLEQCFLGSVHAAASKDAVYIASLTCPHLKDISMLVNDHQAIYALSEFRNLKTLLVQWEKMEYCDYTLGMQLLLEKPEIGLNLTHLYILNFTNVDFSSIGECCPNLEALRVEYEYENNRAPFSPTSFHKLKQLTLENSDDRDCDMGTLVGLLSNATDLNCLAVMYGGRLTDGVLNDILKKNSLSKVKDLRISRCVLSVDGIRQLISSMATLEYFVVSEANLTLDEFAAVVHEINPRIIVSSSYD